MVGFVFAGLLRDDAKAASASFSASLLFESLAGTGGGGDVVEESKLNWLP